MSEEDFLVVSTMMDAKVKPVKSEIQRLRLEMENDYRPRLNTIEATYTGTFKRYESEIENMEQMQLDIGTIKALMTIHSEDIESIRNSLKEHDKRFDRIDNTLQVLTDQIRNLTGMVGRMS